MTFDSAVTFTVRGPITSTQQADPCKEKSLCPGTASEAMIGGGKSGNNPWSDM